MNSRVVDVFDRLRQAGVVGDANLKGCTESEIALLESKIGARFPDAYRTYLVLAGHFAGGFLAESEARYEDLPDIQEALAELPAAWRPSPADFVFMMHQGYEFSFFELGGPEDPEVWQFVEGWEAPLLGWTTFSGFLDDLATRYQESTQY